MKFISFFQNEEDIVYSILKAIYNDKVERWKKICQFYGFFPLILISYIFREDDGRRRYTMFTTIGEQAMFSIISHLFFIGITWWALHALNFEKLLRANKVLQARILYVLLTVAIGSMVSNFFLDYVSWSVQLPSLIQ